MRGWAWCGALALLAACEAEKDASGDTDPGDTDPGVTDPGDTDPGDTDPGDTDPGDTDPGEPDCAGSAALLDGAAGWATVQDALDAAAAGATVLVCPGTHTGPFTASVPVTLEGRDGAAATVLDGDGRGTALTVAPGSVVRGLTVTGGVAEDGGGLALSAPGALALDAVGIEGNTAESRGGGVFAPGVALTVTGASVVRANVAASGGGLWADDATVDLGDALVEANTAAEGGGAWLAEASLVGGAFVGNTAISPFGYSGEGGGLFAQTGIDVTGTSFTGNTSDHDGGGMYLYRAAGTVTDVAIEGNTASWQGGGFAMSSGRVTMTGVRVAGNTADQGGGGLVHSGELTGGEFTGNTASFGGGVFLHYGDLTGATVSANVAEAGGGVVLDEEGGLYDSVVTDHTVPGAGGGVYLRWFSGQYSYDGFYVESCEIARNAALEGGGLYAADGGYYADVRDSNVHDNAAVRGAGLWEGTGWDLYVIGGALTANVASEAGGGIWASAFPGWSLDVSGVDLGEGALDNAPEDVFAGGVSWHGYGAKSTFDCTSASCDPP